VRLQATHGVPRAEVGSDRRSLRAASGAVPAPGSGEVRLRLSWCGLCGTDLHKLAVGSEEPGTVLGHELVGVVESVGEGAGVSPGERVVVTHHVPCGRCRLCRAGSATQCPEFRANHLDPGGFSELVRVGAPAVRETLWRVPPGVPDAAAVFLEPAACVLRGVDRAGLPPEPVVVVMGGGAMGLLHLLVLRAELPCVRVTVVEPLAGRRRLALELGADAAVAPGEAVREGADAVFDTVGGSRALAEAVARARPGGTVVAFAHAADGEVAGFAFNPFFRAEKRLVATYSATPGELRRVAAHLAEGRLDPSPLVTHHLPLERAPEAVELVRARRALKVLLGPGAA